MLKNDLKKIAFIILKTIFIACLIELFFFNYHALFTQSNEYTETILNLKDATLSEDAQFKDDNIICQSKSCDITFNNINTPTRNITIFFSGSPSYNTIVIEFTDFADYHKFITARTLHFNPTDKLPTNSIIYPHKSLKDLKLKFPKNQTTLYIRKIVLNSPITINFNPIRLGILSFFIFWFLLGRNYFSVIYNKNNLLHIIIIWAVIIFCLLINLWQFDAYTTNNPALMDYTEFNNNDIPYTDSYNRLFNAFLNGRIFLSEAAPSLTTLKNPYMPSERKRKSASFQFDFSYYKGKYYVYTGIAPILTFYYPVYWITGFYPSPNLATYFFASLSIVFLFFSLLELCKYYCKKIYLFAFLSVGLATVFSSGVISESLSLAKYNLDKVSSISFSALTIFFAYRAYNITKGKFRNCLLFFAGISFVLVTLSRPPITLITAAFIFPIFINRLLEKKVLNKVRFRLKIKEVLSFTIPVIIGAAATMWYNYERFESVFEFGQSYQLTGQNQTYFMGVLTDLPKSFLGFFLGSPHISNNFPFITPSWNGGNTGKFFLLHTTIGVFFFPLNLLFLISTLAIKKKVWKATVISIFITTVFISFYTFTTAGFYMRYIFDINWSISFISAVTFLALSNYDNIFNSKIYHRVFMLICISTVIVGSGLIFSNPENELKKFAPSKYLYIENLF